MGIGTLKAALLAGAVAAAPIAATPQQTMEFCDKDRMAALLVKMIAQCEHMNPGRKCEVHVRPRPYKA